MKQNQPAKTSMLASRKNKDLNIENVIANRKQINIRLRFRARGMITHLALHHPQALAGNNK